MWRREGGRPASSESYPQNEPQPRCNRLRMRKACSALPGAFSHCESLSLLHHYAPLLWEGSVLPLILLLLLLQVKTKIRQIAISANSDSCEILRLALY